MAKQFAIAVLALTALALAVPAYSAIVLSETFPYADGDLTTVSGGLWAAHSGGGVGPIQVVGGKAIAAFGSEDVNRVFTSTIANNARAYACFELTVPTPASGIVVVSGYFAHFRPAVGFAYRARLRIEPPQSGGNYSLNMNVWSNAVGVYWPTDLNFNQTYVVAMRYDPDSSQATLWINPLSEASPSVTHTDVVNATPETTDAFAIRQFGQDSQQVIDNINCGTSFNDVCPNPTPTNSTTWGRVKALYR
ncbi:MAG: hypothetical protein A2W00_08610 [Candidatus Eisenbacteria bacterium RBG_16_71_46]|nr:MAG: hypothetical protein A2W00_08610 [Candidatus Eisenbacteria bacterium RBG_16_71_46]OGF21117.1 MAG: hypothetical protein A2V63_07185 [Candidatus Eisenbacteria bacterium RBG_19FT_COMBO_70_11]